MARIFLLDHTTGHPFVIHKVAFLNIAPNPTVMDLQKRIDFNQFIKEKINERILKRKILKSKLLKLNSMRNLIERLISNHHQNLYYVSTCT